MPKSDNLYALTFPPTDNFSTVYIPEYIGNSSKMYISHTNFPATPVSIDFENRKITIHSELKEKQTLDFDTLMSMEKNTVKIQPDYFDIVRSFIRLMKCIVPEFKGIVKTENLWTAAYIENSEIRISGDEIKVFTDPNRKISCVGIFFSSTTDLLELPIIIKGLMHLKVVKDYTQDEESKIGIALNKKYIREAIIDFHQYSIFSAAHMLNDKEALFKPVEVELNGKKFFAVEYDEEAVKNKNKAELNLSALKYLVCVKELELPFLSRKNILEVFQ